VLIDENNVIIELLRQKKSYGAVTQWSGNTRLDTGQLFFFDSDFAFTMGYTPLLIETAKYELSGRVIIINDDGEYGQ